MNTIEGVPATNGYREDLILEKRSVPKRCQCEITGIGVVLTVTMKYLTSDDELQAAARSRNNNFRTAHELAKSSIYALNDKKISLAGEAEASTDAAWNRMHPRLRSLIVTAYSAMHNPEDEDTKSFLDSTKIIV